ncbi:MAG: small subunit ribosomal protein, partial [Thermoleophilaceae bacterium]|nr:small subunit ribosomal protein [Thermoleophilaceae bacterium]
KVVSFGAFVEILDGVEGLVHISELAQHHVENPREVVNQGDVIRVKILEIDSDRRRLSLSAKRVEDQELPLRSIGDQPEADAGGDEIGEVRELGLSDDVFADADQTAAPDEVPAAESLEPDAGEAAQAEAPAEESPAPDAEPEATAEPAPDADAAAVADPVPDAEPAAEPEPAPEPEATAEPEPEAPAEVVPDPVPEADPAVEAPAGDAAPSDDPAA